MRTRVAAALALCFLVTAPLLAWGKQGHQIVATIAGRGLSPKVAAQVLDLLDGKTLADVAPLPDEWRSSQPETAGWHFANIPVSDTAYDETRDCPVQSGEVGNNCVVAAIEHFKTVLADGTQSKSDRGRALTFLVHFLGDSHQPLHCADNNDRGGNEVSVTWFGSADLDGYPANLHAVWDEGIIEKRGLSVDDYATKLLKMPKPANVTKGTTADWVNESYNLAKKYAYKLPAGTPPALGQKYYDANLAVVNRQLLRGGLRLRYILETALDVNVKKAIMHNTVEAEVNKAKVIAYWNLVLNDQKFGLMNDTMSPNYQFNGQPTSAAANEAWIKSLHQGMPDLHFTILDLVAEGNKVAVRWQLVGTDAKTGVKGQTIGANIITFQDGKAISNNQAGGNTFTPVTPPATAPTNP
jgi:predicted ester cyclase